MDLSNPPIAALPLAAKGNDIDRKVRAALARTTGSLSVASGLLAAGDWAMNLAVSPGKQMELALLFFDYATQVTRYDVDNPTGAGRYQAPAPFQEKADMDPYRAPLADMQFVMTELAGSSGPSRLQAAVFPHLPFD